MKKAALAVKAGVAFFFFKAQCYPRQYKPMISKTFF